MTLYLIILAFSGYNVTVGSYDLLREHVERECSYQAGTCQKSEAKEGRHLSTGLFSSRHIFLK